MELTAADFGAPVQARSLPAALRETPHPATGLDFEQTVSRLERQLLEDALRQTNGNKTAAAELLGLKRTTLTAKLRALGAAA
jgi:DNA-binding NtrC family response regulator